MRSIILLFCVFSLASCANSYQETENEPEDYAIIPKPVELVPDMGQFHLTKETTLTADPQLSQEATYLQELLKDVTGRDIKIVDEANFSDRLITLQLDDTIENKEGYKLLVNPESVTIVAKDGSGIFYGIQSLRQLINDDKETIPAVAITDFPRYVYRGMHLDVSRHFFPVDFVKKYIDLIALHKMNTFHWHLTEDQGWRIEIKQYPKLTEVGGFRNGTIVGHNPGTENDQQEYGGFYTQDEIKEVVKYAQARHVTIIPEIELPGHSSAAIAAYPYLSCFPDEKTVVGNDMMSKKGREFQQNGTPKIVQETWGVFDDVYCAGKEETFTFLENVLTEVMALFPSNYIHIGGDESPKANWERCPNCQKKIADNNLQDEHELQSYFIQRIEKFANTKGKSIIGWDEILEGGLAPNATVMSWRGIDGGIAAAKQRHDVIMTPGDFCYFDKYQANPDDEPLAIGGFLPLEKVYGYEPTPEELTDEEAQHILGAQANVWTEYMDSEDYVEYMILPRMTALAEVVWSPKNSRDFSDFSRRLTDFEKMYTFFDVNYAKKTIPETEVVKSE